METSSASSLSASGICSGLLTGAISTLMPFCNMGVTTMKMISKTSITSTMGVTLISELTFAPSFRFANAMAWYLPYFYRTCTARSGAFSDPASSWEGPAPDRSSAGQATHCGNQTEPFLTLPCDRHHAIVTLRTPLPANIAALFQEVIDQLARRVIHLHVEGF